MTNPIKSTERDGNLKGAKNYLDSDNVTTPQQSLGGHELFDVFLKLIMSSFILMSLSFGFMSILQYRFEVDIISASLDALDDSQDKLKEIHLYTPEQLHLSMGASSSEMYVTWSTMKRASESKVIFKKLSRKSQASGGNVVVGRMDRWIAIESDPSWIHTTGRISRQLYTYRALLTNLELGAVYGYQIEAKSPAGLSYLSEPYRFIAKPFDDPHRPVSLAFYGDLGLVNGQSIDRLIGDVDNGLYDLIIHNGDFAYDLDTHHGQYGDEFMRKIEPIAARLPYQTSVGNHEIAQNFTHYDKRFTMVNSGGSSKGEINNFFYSFNVGPIHFIGISTEFYYFLFDLGLEPLHRQYKWLEKDLAYASSLEQRTIRPWIVVFGHRPMYCSSRDKDDCSKPNNILRKGLPFFHTYALEKLFYDYGVDVQLYSHEHQYERFLPIYDEKVFNGTDLPDRPYHNPLAPVHIISGSAGCQERLDPFKGIPATGSIKQISDYGYTRLKATRCELDFQQISDDKDGTIVDEFKMSKTRQNFPPTMINISHDC